MSSLLFSPISVGHLTLANRIVIPPMCMYSAINGQVQDWHLAHYGTMAASSCGLLIVEATAIAPEGRISAHCLGIWSDACEAGLKRLVDFTRSVFPVPMAIQLCHAGRKAGRSRPWEGSNKKLSPSEGGWQTIAPSALACEGDAEGPLAMSDKDIARVKQEFVSAAERAVRCGFDAIELHAAHGYLLHQFLSPLTNKRTDMYGGNLQNRMRFPLEVFDAVRAVLPATCALGVRISGTDWLAGGWNLEEAVIFSQHLKERESAYIHVSGGGLFPSVRSTENAKESRGSMRVGPGYQTDMAMRVRSETGVPTIAVGMITEAEQAETILLSGQADMVAIGRAMLNDPRWPWHAAIRLRQSLNIPNQYLRSAPYMLVDARKS